MAEQKKICIVCGEEFNSSEFNSYLDGDVCDHCKEVTNMRQRIRKNKY